MVFKKEELAYVNFSLTYFCPFCFSQIKNI